MQIMLLLYKNIFSVSDDMPWHRLRQHRRGGIMAKHMGYHESVPPGLSLNVTNLRNALIAVGTCHNAVHLRNAHIVVGTCHGMSADATLSLA